MTTPEPAGFRQAALDYHSQAPVGKLAISPTKPLFNQRDLSLAYSPGVAAPCEEIVKDPATAYKYTARGNLVARHQQRHGVCVQEAKATRTKALANARLGKEIGEGKTEAADDKREA